MPSTFLDYITLGMGNARSKPKDRFERTKKESSTYATGRRDENRSNDESRSRDISPDIRERFAEDEELMLIRHTIQCNPDLFVLNNLMMSVQFFENYDEEIVNIRQTLASPRETELNDRLPSQKHTLIPDVLQQHVAQKIDFTYMHPTLKFTIELLQPIRIYVAFDNIEVTENNYASPYSTLNGMITYSMQLKPSPSHKGYVLLQRLDVNPKKKSRSVDNLDLSTASNKNGIYSDGDSVYGVQTNVKNYRDVFVYPSTSRKPDEAIYGPSSVKTDDSRVRGPKKNNDRQYATGSTSSGYRSDNCMDSDSDYSYARTIYNGSKSSNGSMSNDSTISTNEIPRRCFRKIEYTADGKIYDAKREKKYRTNSKEHLMNQAYKNRNYNVLYLNSAKFMKHFCHLFTVQLAEPMGFPTETRHNVHGGAICQTKLEIFEGTTSTRLEQYEILPCVKFQWPECAQEWLDRPRIGWPNYSIVEKVREFGCHLIPEGIVTDNDDGYRDLEWQLVFPAAERYLETCLSHSQVRVYLVALMLRKTFFVRPVDAIFGLTVSHIKNKLFWMVEEDDRPSSWMDNRNGESLMKLLNSIYRSISQDSPNLPDYFVREKNLFREKSYLFSTQKQLKRIIENPVMYVFHAMENIRHSSSFFPRLNYEKLFRLLTDDELTIANPSLVSEIPRQVSRSNGVERDNEESGRLWDKNSRNEIYEQSTNARKPIAKRNLINPKQAYNQIVEIPIRCGKMEPSRLSGLLDFFIRHFIKMAETCHNYRAISQKIIYVDHAERLSLLLSEHPSHKDIAIKYFEKLNSIRKRAPRSRLQNATTLPDPPETPKRNPDRAIFARPLNRRYESPDDSEENKKFVRISQSDDGKIRNKLDPEMEKTSVSGARSPTRGTHGNKSIVAATIHEEDSEDSTIRRSKKTTTTDNEPEISGKKTTRVVSIVDTQEESFLTETTYI